MKVCHVGDESLSCIYLLFIQRNRAKRKKNFQRYHREKPIVYSIVIVLGRSEKRIFKFLSDEN